jgi:transcriptional antiterminator NusG
LGKIDEMTLNPDMMKIPYSIGENVVITDGPFANFNATVDEIDEEKRRITVGIKIFGRTTPLTVEFGQVRRGD